MVMIHRVLLDTTDTVQCVARGEPRISMLRSVGDIQ